jgi:predicted DNA binding protein
MTPPSAQRLQARGGLRRSRAAQSPRPRSVRGSRPRVKRSASPTIGTLEGYSLYRVEVPLSKDGWGYHFSRAHPSMRLEMLDRIEVGENLMLAEVRMMGPGAYDWPAESRRFPNVMHIETHPEGPSSVLYRVTYRTPSIHTITQRHGVLTRYPIVVQNGISQFETFAGQAQMRNYLNELRRRVGPSQVGLVHQGSVTAQNLGLTPGQAVIFQEAVEAGFFQVPRRITLTGLAERLGRSKSTVSTALVRIRKQLAESALQVDLEAFHSSPSVGLAAG